MFLTPQSGALCPRIVQSHKSSYNHPLTVPVSLLSFLLILQALPGDARLRSVVNTFIGFQDRTSHTTTIPSWNATENLEPEGENTVKNDTGSLVASGRVEGSAEQVG
jgi:hypothetical protein